MLRRFMADTMSTPGSIHRSPVGTTFQSQCLGEFLARLRKIDPHPAVLDLGALCGTNIAFLGAKGCRVSVESLPAANPLQPAVSPKGAADVQARAAAPVSPLGYPPESFSGILAWDAIARMPMIEATGFVETLRRLLMGGGVILAYFPGPPANPGGAAERYRILTEDRLAAEPAAHRRLPQKAYQNREIYGLFSRFDVVRLSHLKSGTREVLVAKSRRPGRD